jgi:hypothetical protein
MAERKGVGDGVLFSSRHPSAKRMKERNIDGIFAQESEACLFEQK